VIIFKYQNEKKLEREKGSSAFCNIQNQQLIENHKIIVFPIYQACNIKFFWAMLDTSASII
jgi:hypothetical protein